MSINVKWIEERWIPALESGEYVQAKDYLSTDDHEYCCLGVACDLAMKDGSVNGQWNSDSYPRAFVCDDGDYDDAELPVSMIDFLGISPDGSVLLPNGEEFTYFAGELGGSRTSLAGANDDGFTFFEIAQGLRRLCEYARTHDLARA